MAPPYSEKKRLQESWGLFGVWLDERGFRYKWITMFGLAALILASFSFLLIPILFRPCSV